MAGHYADENMYPQAPDRSEFDDEGSFAECMELFNANQAIRKNQTKVLYEGCMVDKHMLFNELKGEQLCVS